MRTPRRLFVLAAWLAVRRERQTDYLHARAYVHDMNMKYPGMMKVSVPRSVGLLRLAGMPAPVLTVDSKALHLCMYLVDIRRLFYFKGG